MEWNPFPYTIANGGNESRVPALLSMRKFPIESDIATMYSAYFVSYLITDLVLGFIYYRRYLDPLSGWTHHLGYLGVVSNATMQKNVSTLFAIGTPIELSTIFLAIGHIFPKLRSDLLFGTSFFLIRIVYPLVLLPELYLNVEARLCWKVCLSAFILHVHWFSKLVQQQVRYYNARKGGCTTQNASQPLVSHETTKKIDNGIHEFPLSQVSKVNDDNVKSLSVKADIQLAKKNSLSGLHQTVLNQLEVNGSGRNVDSKKSKALRRSACPSFDLAYCDDESEANDKVTPIPAVAPLKTMKQLLEECEQDDLSSYAFPIQGIAGNGNNKTFSPQALSRLISSKGSESAVTGGALRLSRASSMRDQKKRVALGSIKFEEAKVPVSRPKSMVVSTPRQSFEADATVVFRQRSSRASIVLEGPEEKDQGYDFDMGTIRAARGVSVNA
ncbi:hypothetical protein BGZ76_010346 [Entomortierella beljakovae]|nr:hypothetical protein BGZ76_010346 [Entomortierella beljakovae]